jgi:hypothetical protein
MDAGHELREVRDASLDDERFLVPSVAGVLDERDALVG